MALINYCCFYSFVYWLMAFYSNCTGKFGALLASIPLPIVAALYCVFFGYVGMYPFLVLSLCLKFMLCLFSYCLVSVLIIHIDHTRELKKELNA